jgi:hypothetical protein
MTWKLEKLAFELRQHRAATMMMRLGVNESVRRLIVFQSRLRATR